MNVKNLLRAAVIGLLATLGCMSPAYANANVITYQGVLSDDGTPFTGASDMSFSLWDAATGGGMVWGVEFHTAVPVSDGVFAVLLGSQTAFGTTFETNSQLWLEVGADTGNGPQIFSPRVPFAATPYAFMAARAASAATADTATTATSAATAATATTATTATTANTANTVDWSGVANVPADLADGDDVDGGAAASAPWSGLTGVPAGFLDGVDNVDGGAAASAPWAGLTGVPAGFLDGLDDVDGGAAASAPWAGLTGVPAGFADGTDNVDGGNANLLDGIDSTGFAGVAHTHSGADITTGTVDVSRLPVGTGVSDVAAGNHAHNSLNASDGSPTNSVYVDAVGEVGIGTTTPGQALEVNGAMQFTGNAAVANQTTGVISRAPRVIHSEDPRGGCPDAAWPANTAFWTSTFTLTRPATVYIHGSIIRNSNYRHDLALIVDGNQADLWITNTGAHADWQNGAVHWSGVLAAGIHNVWMQSGSVGVWGCTAPWGSLDILIFE